MCSVDMVGVCCQASPAARACASGRVCQWGGVGEVYSMWTGVLWEKKTFETVPGAQGLSPWRWGANADEVGGVPCTGTGPPIRMGMGLVVVVVVAVPQKLTYGPPRQHRASSPPSCGTNYCCGSRLLCVAAGR